MKTRFQAYLYLAWERTTEFRGEQRGKLADARLLVFRQLTRPAGELPDAMRSQIDALVIAQLETLAEALFRLCRRVRFRGLAFRTRAWGNSTALQQFLVE